MLNITTNKTAGDFKWGSQSGGSVSRGKSAGIYL